jgi:serine protease Do
MKRLVVVGLVVAAGLGPAAIAHGYCYETGHGFAAGHGAVSGLRAGSANAHGVPGYLGINVQNLSEDRAGALKLKDGRGVEITDVDHDGPAGKMGLREHDVVIRMNGTNIEGADQMRHMLHEMSPGKNVTLVILRDGQQTMTVTAQMADRVQVDKQAWAAHLSSQNYGSQQQAYVAQSGAGDEDEAAGSAAETPVPGGKYSKGFLGTLLMSPSYTGVILEKMGPQLATFFGSHNGSGLLVRSVEVNSPGAQAGLLAGDVVIRANTVMVANMSDWARQIKEAKGHPVMVVVLRDKAEKTLTLVPDGKKRSQLEWPLGVGAVMAKLAEM